MTARKSASRRSLKSDLSRVDAHTIRQKEYRELPQLTTEMLSRGKVKRGGRPLSPNPRSLDGRRRALVGRREWLSV
jgi:hypothetical protein